MATVPDDETPPEIRDQIAEDERYARNLAVMVNEFADTVSAACTGVGLIRSTLAALRRADPDGFGGIDGDDAQGSS